MKANFFHLALAVATAAAVLNGAAAAAAEAITPQVLSCAAAAALRGVAAPSSSLPAASCLSRCDLSLVSLAGGASSSTSSSAPLRLGINAVSLKGMNQGVWEAVAVCGRGCSVIAAAAAVGGEENAHLSSSSSSSSPSSTTARFPFILQQCNGTLTESMAEMEARFVVREAQDEAASKGKSSGGVSPLPAKTRRGVVAGVALAASQVGLVALAVA